jgi:integrase
MVWVDRGAPVMATATHAVIRKLFYWAIDREIIDASPCVRVPKPATAAERDRVLSDDELRAVWLACEAMQWPFGPTIRLMILTGQRESEVGGMRWEEMRGNVWTIPGDRTKNGHAQEVPLSRPAKAIIAELRKVDLGFVFTTTGKKPIAGFNNAKRRLDGLCRVKDWRFHDLRRTVATGMARLGVAPHIVEKVLNHQTGTISGVAAIYNRHAYTDEKLAALELWARHVLSIA